MAMRWYVMHVYSGFEKKAKQAIIEKAEKLGLSHSFEDILVPTEEVVELKRGQKVSAERKFFPGYVLIKMEMTDQTWHLVRDTPKVTGFLGGSVDLDERGFIVTNRMMETSVHGVFAAGDVRAGSTKQLASAVGEGAAVALQIRAHLDELSSGV